MQNILKSYDYVIIDFSAMFAELDASFILLLNSAENVFVAPTFECECKQIQNVVPYRVANRYKENKGNVNLDTSNVCEIYGTIDTFGLANCLSHDFNSVLVIEANYSLEDCVVLSGMGVDVYSLLEDKLIKHENYLSEVTLRTIDKSKTPLTYYQVNSGDAVYTDNYTYVLADSLEGGAEAQVYRVSNNPKILAKVYKEDEDGNFVLTSQKLNNINVLIEVNNYWDVLWLALPTAVIYADPAKTKPVGYLMKYFDETKFISNNSLFNGGDINLKFPEHDEVTVKDILNICIKFVRQILFLALNDIHISDYNDKNFAISIKDDSKIVMVDTDSYCCESYISECMTYSGCLSRKYECNNRLDLIHLCDESLFAFIFTRLVLDSSFVPMRKSEFRFSASKVAKLDNPNIKAKWNSIPSNLQSLFIEVFDKKHPPSINVLLYELEVALNHKFANKKYKDIYKEVLDIEIPQTMAQQPVTQPTVPQQQSTQPPPIKPNSPNPSMTATVQPTKSKRMRYVFIGICILIVCCAIWWFGFGHPGLRLNQDSPAEQSSETSTTKEPQLKCYDKINIYKISLSNEKVCNEEL